MQMDATESEREVPWGPLFDRRDEWFTQGPIVHCDVDVYRYTPSQMSTMLLVFWVLYVVSLCYIN